MTDIGLRKAQLPAEDHAYYGLVWAGSKLTALAGERLEREHRLPVTWFEVLLWLYHQDGSLAAGELGSFATLSRSQVSRVLDALQARGLITRTPSAADARSIEVSITSAGRDLFEQADRTRREALAPELAKLEPSEVEELARILSKLKK